MADETIVADDYEIAHKRMRLDPASSPDNGARLHFNEGPDERQVSNTATIEVRRLDDGYAFSKLHIYNAGRLQHRV